MFARLVTLLPLATLAAVAAAAPNVLETRDTCNGGGVYCCNHEIKQIQYFSGVLGGLLSGIDVNGALQCSPITVVDVLPEGCTQQTVCCENVEQNGLVNIGCTPIAL